jgi:hypothetical protein
MKRVKNTYIKPVLCKLFTPSQNVSEELRMSEAAPSLSHLFGWWVQGQICWVIHELWCFAITTGFDEVLADPAVQKFRGLGCSQMYRILTFAVGSFRLYHVLLTEGSILDPCYGIWK